MLLKAILAEKDGNTVKKLAPVAVCALLCSLLAACSLNPSANNGPCTAQNLTMGPSDFCTSAITISKGSTITFVDDPGNGAVHILANGTDGDRQAEDGAPDFGGDAGHSMSAGDKWTTPPWNTPGIFHVTCTVHPNMNLTVTVTG